MFVISATFLCGLLVPASATINNDGPTVMNNSVSVNKSESATVRKCCPHGEIFNESVSGCTLSDRPFRLPDIVDDNGAVVNASINVVYGSMLVCEGLAYIYYLDPSEDSSEEYVILDTGWLRRGDGRREPPKTFCLDQIESKTTVLPFFCYPEDEDPTNDTFAVYPKLMIISLPFLLATFIVYAGIKQLRNLHGKCLMSHVSALSLSYICLTVVQIASEEINQFTCTSLGKQLPPDT